MSVTHNKKILPVYVRGLYQGKYTLAQAAASTGYSIQWLCQLKKAYADQGEAVFVNKNKGRVPHNKLDTRTRQKVAAIYAADYSDVNFCYFTDCLHEFEGMNMSLSTVRGILTEYGLSSPESRKIKKKKVVHRPRLRRECEGDLVQIDGTPFAWFYKFGDENRYCLTGSIDDATGKITGLYMTENECLYGYLEILRQTCERYGVPREYYSDRAAIFCHTPKNSGRNLAQWEKLEIMHEKRTQWQRILDELCIKQTLAWSPEAKGRVERMWQTIQGQLPIWFYKKGIKTIDQANRNMQEYINQFNRKYAVEPAVDDPFWIDAPENLDEILMAQFPRRGSKDGVISFHGTAFYTPSLDLCYKDVIVCISEQGLYAKYRDEYYPMVPIGSEVQQVIGDKMPQVVVNIIYRYLHAFGKEISA